MAESSNAAVKVGRRQRHGRRRFMLNSSIVRPVGDARHAVAGADAAAKNVANRYDDGRILLWWRRGVHCGVERRFRIGNAKRFNRRNGPQPAETTFAAETATPKESAVNTNDGRKGVGGLGLRFAIRTGSGGFEGCGSCGPAAGWEPQESGVSPGTRRLQQHFAGRWPGTD